VEIACLLHSLLKAIHEWVGGDRADPTYLPLLSSFWGQHQSFRKVTFGGHPGRTKPPAACRGGRGWGRAYPVAQFRVLEGCRDLFVNLSQHRMQ
jgi:hypothetical protein